MKNVLLLTDIQNDFVPGGALAIPHGDAVIAVANRLIPAYEWVVATQDCHPADHQSFASQHPGKNPGDVVVVGGTQQQLWPDHCIQDTPGAELVTGLNVKALHHIVFKGTNPVVDSYSAFFDNQRKTSTDLHAFLQEHNLWRIDVMGLATDYCVKYTVLDALELGYDTTILLEGCRGVELQAGDCEQAIREMKQAGATVVTGR